MGGKRRPRGGGGRGGGSKRGGGAGACGRLAEPHPPALRREGRTDGGTERAWAAAHLAGRPPGPPWADSAGQRRSPPPRRRPRSVRARRPRGWVGWGAGRKTALGNVKLRSGIFLFFPLPRRGLGRSVRSEGPFLPAALPQRGEKRALLGTPPSVVGPIPRYLVCKRGKRSPESALSGSLCTPVALEEETVR